MWPSRWTGTRLRERDDMQEAEVGWDAIDVRIVTIDEADDGWA